MTSSSKERMSASDLARARASVRETWPGLLALLVLQGSLLAADPARPARGWVLAWSLSPIVAAVWLAWAQWRSLRRADELQRMVQLEALAVGFAAMLLLALAGGLLDAAGIGDSPQSLQVTFIAGVLAWTAALAVRTWQLR
jgi:hypothetical protein